ncbi:hypothetical protein E4U58_004263 [Claviceps cyperi]|nr:hypothetical protein E4U58_004263 [Claviceps cyperi]
MPSSLSNMHRLLRRPISFSDQGIHGPKNGACVTFNELPALIDDLLNELPTRLPAAGDRAIVVVEPLVDPSPIEDLVLPVPAFHQLGYAVRRPWEMEPALKYAREVALLVRHTTLTVL